MILTRAGWSDVRETGAACLALSAGPPLAGANAGPRAPRSAAAALAGLGTPPAAAGRRRGPPPGAEHRVHHGRRPRLRRRRCYGRRDYTTPNIDRLAAEGMRFTQAYANSAVCSATRVGLITGRYQYRLPVGLEEPLAGTDRRRPAARASHVAVAAAEGRLSDRRWWASGTWARCRSTGRCRAATSISGASTAARSTITRTASRGEADLWDDDVAVRAGRLPDRPDRRPRRRPIDGIAQGEPAVLHQPALQRAALAVGGARRRGGVRSGIAKDRRLRRLRRRHAARPTPRMVQRHGPPDRPRAAGARRAAGCRADTIVVFTSDNGGERFSRHLAVHRQEDRAARRGPAHPGIVRWPASPPPAQLTTR